MHRPILLLLCCLHLAHHIRAFQCYYGKGRAADPQIQNCSSTDGLLSICCKIGHVCLEQGACQDPQTNTIYLYGCTDPEYSNRQCPYKWNVDLDKSPWIGVTKNGCDSSKDVYMIVHPDTCGENCPSAPWHPVNIEYPSNLPCSDINPQYWAYNLSTNADLPPTGAVEEPPKPVPTSENVSTQIITTQQHVSIVTTATRTSIQTRIETVTVVTTGNSTITTPSSDTSPNHESNDNMPAVYGLIAALGLMAAVSIALTVSCVHQKRKYLRREGQDASTKGSPKIVPKIHPDSKGRYPDQTSDEEHVESSQVPIERQDAPVPPTHIPQ